MKQLTCEMCGSTELMKQDGVFVCQSCGTKYSVEEAKKMMIEGTVDVQGMVKVDNSAFVQKYLANARRAKQKEDWAETEKYYNMVEQNDPTNIEAIFYSTFARVKSALLEAETADKRQGVFNVLVKGVSIIDDNYDDTNEEHHKLLFEIKNDIEGLKKGNIVPTTHLQEYVTKNGYGNIVDRNQVVENDSLDVTYHMIDQVMDAYEESVANIIAAQCKDLSKEEVVEKAREVLENGHPDFALDYFNEYTKKEPNSPIGYVGKAFASYYTGEALEGIKHLEKAAQCTVSDDEEKEILRSVINCKSRISGTTLLMYASTQWSEEVVKYLVEAGADVNAKSNWGETALMKASENDTSGSYEIVKYLVEAGADVNAKTNGGVTALWHVCSHKLNKHNKYEAERARKIAKLLLDNGAEIDVKPENAAALYNAATDPEIAQMIKAKFPNATPGTAPQSGGCYVATAVYGSYDCPQVWTLRRYRDYTLAETRYGRAFIRTYYAISPTIVKWFGHTEWFRKMWKGRLDRMVAELNAEGVEDTPYEDKAW